MGKLGLLTALQGRDNFDVQRQEQQRALQLGIINAEMAKRDLKEQEDAAAMAQTILSTPGQIKVLDPAISKIQSLNDKLLEPIREAIHKAGGDMKKFEADGGAILLQRYRDNLVNSPEVAKGIMSAANYNRYIKDSQAGLVPRGTPKEDLDSYMGGNSDFFQYLGGYQQPDLTGARGYFGNNRGKNKYQQQPVDNETLRQYAVTEAKKQGLNQADAFHYADKVIADYDAMIKGGGQPYMFGADTWNPSRAWGDSQDAEESVRYIVDGFKSVLDPDSGAWSEERPASLPSYLQGAPAGAKALFNEALDPTIQYADVLEGLDLGKKSVHVAKGRQVLDKNGQPVTLAQDAYIDVDDRLLPFIKREGKIYMQTVAQQMEGRPPVEVSEGSIDKMFTGITRTPKIVSIIANLRKELKKMGNLSGAGRPDFDNKKSGNFVGVPQGGF